MTLIAGVKYLNEGCIVADIRSTTEETGAPHDVAFKHEQVGKHLHIFGAGHPSLLQAIVWRIQAVVNSLQVQDADQTNGLLCRTLREIPVLEPDESAELIWVFCDPNTNTFKMFQTGIYASGDNLICFVEPSSDKFEYVVGSGRAVWENDFLVSIFERFRRDYGLNVLASALEVEFRTRVSRAGLQTVGNIYLTALVQGSSCSVQEVERTELRFERGVHTYGVRGCRFAKDDDDHWYVEDTVCGTRVPLCRSTDQVRLSKAVGKFGAVCLEESRRPLDALAEELRKILDPPEHGDNHS